jgi:hypothetical protein
MGWTRERDGKTKVHQGVAFCLLRIAMHAPTEEKFRAHRAEC